MVLPVARGVRPRHECLRASRSGVGLQKRRFPVRRQPSLLLRQPSLLNASDWVLNAEPLPVDADPFHVDTDLFHVDAGDSLVALRPRGLNAGESEVDSEGFVLAPEPFVLDREEFVLDREEFVLDREEFVLDREGFLSTGRTPT